jgi:hypothetical protein
MSDPNLDEVMINVGDGTLHCDENPEFMLPGWRPMLNNYESPAWDCLCVLFRTVANILGHICFFVIVGYIAYGRDTIHERLLLVVCAVVPFVLRTFSIDVTGCPANEGRGSLTVLLSIFQLTSCTAAPAVIWSNNKGYYRWLSLFDMLYGFCPNIRLNMLKDGALNYFVDGKCPTSL